jgi:amidase
MILQIADRGKGNVKSPSVLGGSPSFDNAAAMAIIPHPSGAPREPFPLDVSAMTVTRRSFLGVAGAVASTALLPAVTAAETHAAARTTALPASMDGDLLDVTIPRLHAFYDAGKYTATQVTRWHLDRIARYDRVYRAVSHVTADLALRAAAAQDAGARAGGKRFKRGALWGVPIVVKANASVKGLVTSTGWCGYLIPGLELVAPMDATIVAKLKAAGAIIVGQSNMPDFAASDTTISTAFGRTGNAYDARFSPGGSSGGTVTSVAANFAVFGTGTDTGNSIRMPAGTSALVGLFPTRGLVSIAGIHPLDWLRDNAGPIARDVTDAAIALDVMMGEDPRDFRTKDLSAHAQAGPYTRYLKADALMGKRFGVPAFIVPGSAASVGASDSSALHADTRAAFMKALDGLRGAGATVVFDEALLPDTFLSLTSAINTQAYIGEGLDAFLRDYGPAEYHSVAEYGLAVGSPMPAFIRGAGGGGGVQGANAAARLVGSDPQAESILWEPQRRALAAYDAAFERFRLDGLVYPAVNMQPNDETIPLRDGRRSNGPHSNTDWVNPIGVPAIVVPGGFYDSGLPFGLELAARRWRDGDLIGWAFAYEQTTKHRKPPVLRDRR